MNTTAIETDQAENGTPGLWTLGCNHGVLDHIDVMGKGAICRMFTEPGINSGHPQSSSEALINARLIVAAVNAVRAAMPDLTDEQRIERLGDLTQPESAKSMGPALVARVKIRAALEAIGR